jgi:Flp pilus assembly protein TadG
MIKAYKSGQATFEFGIIVSLLLVLALAVVDLSRALNDIEVMAGLSRQGGNLASRGDTAAQTAAALVSGDAPLNLQKNGEVIITAVINNGTANKPKLVITDQASAGGLSFSSKLGTGIGSSANPNGWPASAQAIPQAEQTVYVAEVFYSYAPITPIGKFMKLVLPPTLYQAAYF